VRASSAGEDWREKCTSEQLGPGSGWLAVVLRWKDARAQHSAAGTLAHCKKVASLCRRSELGCFLLVKESEKRKVSKKKKEKRTKEEDNYDNCALEDARRASK